MHIDIQAIGTVLSYALPIIAAYLMRSPIGQKTDSKTMRVLATFTPDNIQKAVDFLTDKNVRRDAAITKITALAGKQDINLDRAAAGQVVDALAKGYKHIIGDIKRLRK